MMNDRVSTIFFFIWADLARSPLIARNRTASIKTSSLTENHTRKWKKGIRNHIKCRIGIKIMTPVVLYRAGGVDSGSYIIAPPVVMLTPIFHQENTPPSFLHTSFHTGIQSFSCRHPGGVQPGRAHFKHSSIPHAHFLNPSFQDIMVVHHEITNGDQKTCGSKHVWLLPLFPSFRSNVTTASGAFFDLTYLKKTTTI